MTHWHVKLTASPLAPRPAGHNYLVSLAVGPWGHIARWGPRSDAIRFVWKGAAVEAAKVWRKATRVKIGLRVVRVGPRLEPGR